MLSCCSINTIRVVSRGATSSRLIRNSVVVRSFSSSKAAEPTVVVPLITDTLEWTLSSPPPLHQFEEPPIFVETDHLSLSPGVEVDELLKTQGETVSEVIGADKWEQKDLSEFEGKIPQDRYWTEFIAEEKK